MASVSRGTLLAAAALLAVLVLSLLVPVDALDRVRGLVASPYFPLILLSLYAVRPFLAWPVSAISVLVGYKYGIVLGVPLALAGCVATSLLPYHFGDRLPTAAGLLSRVDRGGRRYFAAAGDTRGVAAARLAPTPAEVVSIGAGIAGVPLRAFALGTVIGELPWTVAAVSLGASLDTFSLTTAVDPLFVAACILLAILAVAGPVWRALKA